MQRKHILIALGVLAAILIFLLLAIALTLSGGDTDNEPGSDPFGDTSAVRPYDPNQDDPFSDTGDRDPSDVAQVTTLDDGQTVRLITQGPVVGNAPFTRKRADTIDEPFVRYTLHNSGNIYETPLSRTTAPTLLSERTILRIGESTWSATGASTLLRYTNQDLDTVFTFLGRLIEPETASGTTATDLPEFDGAPIEGTVYGGTFSPDGTSLFYLTEGETGSVGIVRDVAMGTERTVWSSPLRGLTAQWGAPDTIVVYTNASDAAEGAVWFVDPADGSERLVVSGERGLTALLNPTGEYLLYSFRESENDVYTLRVVELATQNLVFLPLPTLAEKCVWGRVATEYVYCATPRTMGQTDFIDGWYRGTLRSDDNIWRYNAETGNAKRLLNPNEALLTPMDLIELAIDPTDTYLTFQVRDTGALYALELPDDIKEVVDESVAGEE